MQRDDICSTRYQTCKLLVGKGVSKGNKGLRNDLVRRQWCARFFLVVTLLFTVTRITKSTSMSIMVSVHAFLRLSDHTFPSTSHGHRRVEYHGEVFSPIGEQGLDIG